MSNSEESAFASIEKLISISIIQEDAETVYSLMKSERDPIFSMLVLPYYALFVQSCQEFMEESCIEGNNASAIKNIRNYIKAFSDRFGASKKRINHADSQQDDYFRSLLRFDFMKSWNIHLNLGTYWTDDDKIVGNTQMIADCLCIDGAIDETYGQKMLSLGYDFEVFTNSIREGIASKITPPIINRQGEAVVIPKYYDLNTNKKNSLFPAKQPKELNLYFLNLLCNMNFVKHVLRKLLDSQNLWLFRVQYVVTYYTYMALIRLKNYCDNNPVYEFDTSELDEIFVLSEGLFQTKLRNCMMHYGLENEGILTPENIEKPFYGIIESCFPNLDYSGYCQKLQGLSDQIIRFLESKFDFSNIKLSDLSSDD